MCDSKGNHNERLIINTYKIAFRVIGCLGAVLGLVLVLGINYHLFSANINKTATNHYPSNNALNDSEQGKNILLRGFSRSDKKNIMSRVRYLSEYEACPTIKRCHFGFRQRNEENWVLRGPDSWHEGIERGKSGEGLFLSTPSEVAAAAPRISPRDIVISYFPGATIPLSRAWVTPRGGNSSSRSVIRRRGLKRKRLAAMILNECSTEGRREVYVKELLRHQFPLTVYGDCGAPCPGEYEENCLAHLAKHYKFILIFEPIICQYHGGERLWRVLKHTHLVPVVFGGLDYAEILPPKSFIDALSQSPESLSHYLQFLSERGDLYREYLNWKRDFLLEYEEWPCALCKKLLNRDILSSPHSSNSISLVPPATRCTSWPDLNFN